MGRPRWPLPDGPHRLGDDLFRVLWPFGMIDGDACASAQFGNHSRVRLLSRKPFPHEVFETLEVQIPHLSRWFKHELALLRDSGVIYMNASRLRQVFACSDTDRMGCSSIFGPLAAGIAAAGPYEIS